ncbi:MAG TPA: hypothetical protein VGS08_04765 [Candidatus Saccharimonadales bacterium]|nr:hypothetical protein [Candidatus Saccharimonadales bacterium]
MAGPAHESIGPEAQSLAFLGIAERLDQHAENASNPFTQAMLTDALGLYRQVGSSSGSAVSFSLCNALVAEYGIRSDDPELVRPALQGAQPVRRWELLGQLGTTLVEQPGSFCAITSDHWQQWWEEAENQTGSISEVNSEAIQVRLAAVNARASVEAAKAGDDVERCQLIINGARGQQEEIAGVSGFFEDRKEIALVAGRAGVWELCRDLCEAKVIDLYRAITGRLSDLDYERISQVMEAGSFVTSWQITNSIVCALADGRQTSGTVRIAPHDVIAMVAADVGCAEKWRTLAQQQFGRTLRSVRPDFYYGLVRASREASTGSIDLAYNLDDLVKAGADIAKPLFQYYEEQCKQVAHPYNLVNAFKVALYAASYPALHYSSQQDERLGQLVDQVHTLCLANPGPTLSHAVGTHLRGQTLAAIQKFDEYNWRDARRESELLVEIAEAMHPVLDSEDIQVMVKKLHVRLQSLRARKSQESFVADIEQRVASLIATGIAKLKRFEDLKLASPNKGVVGLAISAEFL